MASLAAPRCWWDMGIVIIAPKTTDAQAHSYNKNLAKKDALNYGPQLKPK